MFCKKKLRDANKVEPFITLEAVKNWMDSKLERKTQLKKDIVPGIAKKPFQELQIDFFMSEPDPKNSIGMLLVNIFTKIRLLHLLNQTHKVMS